MHCAEVKQSLNMVNKLDSESKNKETGNGVCQYVNESTIQNLYEKNEKQKRYCDVLDKQFEHLGKGTTWFAIILGQIVSVLLCVSAFTTVHLVEKYKVQIPNAQNFTFYFILASVFTTFLACRPAERNLFPVLRTRGWKYMFVALIDAESKYLVNKSFQLTSLTSVQLLDCFSIPTVLSLSWLVLKIRFRVPHILGVSICMLGVSCLVWADIEEGTLPPNGSIKDRFVGDMICLTGAFLMGISNIAQELVVKNFDGVEFLGMIGLFGSFVSGAQTLLLEYGSVAELNWSDALNTEPLVLIAIYAGTQVAFYVLSTFVIKWSSATLLNLSLLSADFYTLIVAIYFLRVRFHALYFLSYALVMVGVITFSIKPTILGSHVYTSLTREITRTLDLELMSSSPSANTQNHLICYYDKEDEIHVGGDVSLLCTKKSSLNRNNKSPMLSNESCDVVLQTTSNIGRGECNGTLRRQGTKGINESIAEEDDC